MFSDAYTTLCQWLMQWTENLTATCMQSWPESKSNKFRLHKRPFSSRAGGQINSPPKDEYECQMSVIRSNNSPYLVIGNYPNNARFLGSCGKLVFRRGLAPVLLITRKGREDLRLEWWIRTDTGCNEMPMHDSAAVYLFSDDYSSVR